MIFVWFLKSDIDVVKINVKNFISNGKVEAKTK